MENLYLLELPDILAIAFGIAIANALALLLFIIIGWSTIPVGTGLLMSFASFLLVVATMTVLPIIAIFALIFASS